MKTSSLGLFFALSIFYPITNAASLTFNTQDFRPFTYQQDDIVAGPGAELVELICQSAGFDCSINLMNWGQAQQEAKDKKVDGLFVIGWNEKRSEWLHYSLPIINTQYGFFVQESNTKAYTTLTSFADHIVGVFGPSNTSKSLEKIQKAVPSLKISMAPDDLISFQMLSDGKVEAVYSNRDVGLEILKQLKISNVRYAWRHKTLNYYIGFVKHHTSRRIINDFNKTLKTLYRSGEAQKILAKYQIDSPMEADTQ
ncbi:amino acid ABC transporter substrate-binding protein [Hahella sp. CCB-MM4]|uniref:substrate-binding periplasmic protein n=1 Tax=Hahella sp. (strain CCB-MM4) TaxID=1926491 RepID=UPI000B9C4BE7|nr:transporter substrate-binding domain-containing protein [Hahella sp. CCB-MM4]OZG73818.1 amino acid ABC transporter substrate-binding protein [Hahella sp. CCB-MM4]